MKVSNLIRQLGLAFKRFMIHCVLESLKEQDECHYGTVFAKFLLLRGVDLQASVITKSTGRLVPNECGSVRSRPFHG